MIASKKRNKDICFENLIPVSSVYDKSIAADLYEIGYGRVLTCGEFEEKFPGLPTDYMYYLRQVPSLVVYYNDESGVCLSTYISNRVGKISVDKILAAIDNAEDAYDNEDYSTLITNAPDAFRNEIALAMMKSRRKNKEKVFDASITFHELMGYGLSMIDKSVVQRVLLNASEDVKKATAEALKDYPETITVYCGLSDIVSSESNVYSWSPNKVLAYHWSAYYGNPTYIVEGTVEKSDISCCLVPDGLSENKIEFIIDPDKVSITRKQKVIGLETLDSYFSGNRLYESEEDGLWEMFDTYKEIIEIYYNESKYSKDCVMHDGDHALRVLFYSLLMACSKKLNAEIFESLAESAAAHDIGRITDDRDDKHGKVAVRLLADSDEMSYHTGMEFLIKFHNAPINEAKLAYDALPSTPVKRDIWTAFLILRDAEKLDKVRYGIDKVSLDDIHNEIAYALFPLAFECQDKLHTDKTTY